MHSGWACVWAFIGVGVISLGVGGCAATQTDRDGLERAEVAAPASDAANPCGLLLTGAKPYEVIINGRSHGSLPGAGGELKVDLPSGTYEITFVDKTGAVALSTSYEAELTGDGYVRLHHAPSEQVH